VNSKIEVDGYVLTGGERRIYRVVKLLSRKDHPHAELVRCNWRTLSAIPGSRRIIEAVQRLKPLSPLEVMARLGKRKTWVMTGSKGTW
jgi:hypothetical protein